MTASRDRKLLSPGGLSGGLIMFLIESLIVIGVLGVGFLLAVSFLALL